MNFQFFQRCIRRHLSLFFRLSLGLVAAALMLNEGATHAAPEEIYLLGASDPNIDSQPHILPNTSNVDERISPTSSGLIAKWDMDEGTGLVINDSSGNGHHGTVHGATWVDGKVGKALRFDGEDDYVEVGTLPGGDRLTIVAWVKRTDDTGWGYIVGNHPFANGTFLSLNADDNTARFSLDLNGERYVETTGVTPVDGEWHFIAGVYDGATAKIYFDGVLNNTRTGLSGVQPGFTAAIGKELYGGGNYFEGIIDQVAIYNRALTAEEIEALYLQEGFSRVFLPLVLRSYNPALIAKWDMDEGTGLVINDSSGNGHHGTVHGATWVDGKVGKALRFDGEDDYVEVGTLPGGDRLTIVAWVKRTDDTGWGYIVGNHPFANGTFLSLNADDNTARFSLDLNGERYVETTGVTPVDGEWHFIAGVYDGATAKIYFDGVLNNTRTGLSGVQPGFTAAIGKELYGGGNYFEGIIDQVAIYKVALTSEEIESLYIQGM